MFLNGHPASAFSESSKYSVKCPSLPGNEGLASILLLVVCNLSVFGIIVIATLSNLAFLLTDALENQDSDLCRSLTASSFF